MNNLYRSMQPVQPNIIQQFKQFKQTFKGNPQQQIQQMLNNGKVTQAQYNAAVQKAQMLQRMLMGN